MHKIWRLHRATDSPTPRSTGCDSRQPASSRWPRGSKTSPRLPEPIGELISSTIRPNGLRIDKVRVPLGVVFFIYESRPNVTADAAAICVKGGNAVILRGGKEAIHSSQAIVELLAEAAEEVGLPADAVQLVSTTDRDAVGQVSADAAVHRRGDSARRRRTDSPRGRRSPDAGHQAFQRQLPRVRRRVGRFGHGRARFSSTASASGWACAMRPSRCWCMPTSPASSCPRLARRLAKQGIEIRGDERTCELIPAAKPVTDEDYATEYLGPDHFGARGRFGRGSHRPHQSLRLEAHGRDRHERSGCRRERLRRASIARR